MNIHRSMCFNTYRQRRLSTRQWFSAARNLWRTNIFIFPE